MQTLRIPREELGKKTREGVVVYGLKKSKETLMREEVDEEEERKEGRRLDRVEKGKSGPGLVGS